MLLRPLYAESAAEATTIVDFAWVQLNPAAQQQLQLPECPAESFLTLFPTAQAAGVFGFYRDAFVSGQVERRQNLYQADGLDGYYQLAAQRQGPLLVVSFSDTNEQPRSVVEDALRASEAREQAARAEAEAASRRFYHVLMQLPAQVAVNRGPNHVFELVNAPYQQLFPARLVQGLPAQQALPELQGQPFFDLLDRVYQTEEPFYGRQMPASVDFTNSGQLEQRYMDVFFQPLHNAQGQVDGVLNFSYDVTEQVLARQQVQNLNEGLAATNEELRAANDEYLMANTALLETQQQLRQLNQELEARVQERTREALALQAELLAAAQRQAQMRESFYQVFEQTPAAVSLLRGPSYRFEYVNPVYQQVFAGRQLVGLDFAEALPDAAAQGYLALLDRVYHTGETYFGAEIPFVSEQPGAPAHTLYFNFTYHAYRENNQIVGISTFALDVTELVQARQAREEQQRELQNLFAQAPMAIMVLRGPEFIIEQANASAEIIWGRSAAEVLGRPHFQALPDSAGQGFEQLLTGVLESGEAMVLREVPIELARTHTGQPNVGYYNIIFKPLFDGQQRATGIVVMWTETTEQVHARQQVQDLNEELAVINEELRATNEELHQSNHQLTRTNVDLDTFVYTASHDLKAPIANLEGLLDALQHELPAEVQQQVIIDQLLSLMQRATERFRLTINQLTDVSRLQHAQNQPAEYVPLAPVVADVQLDLQPLLTHTNAHLTVEVAPDLTVLFSPKNLRSVVYNLLSNALKYHQPDQRPVVLLRALRTSRQVILTVTDNGLGLTEQQQTRLFGLFQRLHTHVEGTGVGLYMVKRVVENAGGSITVESQPGQGSVFRVTLPAGTP